MKKIFIWFLSLILAFSILFIGIGCKEEAAPVDEAAEEAEPADEAAEEAEPADEAAEAADDIFEIALVVKLEGIAWFDNTRVGMEKFAEDFGQNAYQVGADTADPAAQVALVEDLVAKGVDAILVIPNDPTSLEPVFKKANDAGILTLTHEASVQKNISYDIEAFDNIEYGRHMMDIMADWMNEEGEYASFVGHLTSTTHNEWIDGAIMQQEENYPNMTLVEDRLEDQEDQQLDRQKALELLAKYPDLKGIMGSAMSGVPGFSQAIEEKDRIGKTAAFGTCLPSVAGDYIKSGAAQSIHFWVPSDAAYVTAYVAYQLLLGNEITEGMDLQRPGYESITIQQNAAGENVIYGQAWQDVNIDNLDEWIDENGDYKL